MSESTLQPDPVTPQPNPVAPRRSFAGPLVLVLVGLVFLLVNFGAMSLRSIGVWFAEFWPVLLILWGLHKVWEYYQAKQGGYAPAGIGFGGVFFVLVLIIFGTAATQIARAPWDRIGDELSINVDGENDFPFVFGRKHYFTETMEQAFPAGADLRVASDRGDIQVVAGADDKLRV
ncbi:MAG: LiaF transmembrane domain-containing protein, partial [Terriglobales bacterium]